MANRSRTATRQAWVDRIDRFDKAGQTVSQFCVAEGVSPASFYRHHVARSQRHRRVVDDATIPIDNNDCEQLMKRVAKGRNYAEFPIMLSEYHQAL